MPDGPTDTPPAPDPLDDVPWKRRGVADPPAPLEDEPVGSDLEPLPASQRVRAEPTDDGPEPPPSDIIPLPEAGGGNAPLGWPDDADVAAAEAELESLPPATGATPALPQWASEDGPDGGWDALPRPASRASGAGPWGELEDEANWDRRPTVSWRVQVVLPDVEDGLRVSAVLDTTSASSFICGGDAAPGWLTDGMVSLELAAVRWTQALSWRPTAGTAGVSLLLGRDALSGRFLVDPDAEAPVVDSP